MGRTSAKITIDILANAAKNFVLDCDMMPVYRYRRMPTLFTERIHQTESCRKRFLHHAHHDYDVTAAIRVWNHPEEMEYVSVDLLEDHYDLDDEKDFDKYLNKQERGVIEYVRYRFPYENRVFTVKTEVMRFLYEQFYAIFEERE